MKTFFLTMLFLTQALFSPVSQAENFVYGQDKTVIAKYGDYAFEAVKKPWIFKAIKLVKPNFKAEDVYTSAPTITAKLNDKTIAILSGSAKDGGIDKKVFIFIEDKTGVVYVLADDPKSSVGYRIFGMPDEKMKALMMDFSFPK